MYIRGLVPRLIPLSHSFGESAGSGPAVMGYRSSWYVSDCKHTTVPACSVYLSVCVSVIFYILKLEGFTGIKPLPCVTCDLTLCDM